MIPAKYLKFQLGEAKLQTEPNQRRHCIKEVELKQNKVSIMALDLNLVELVSYVAHFFMRW